MSCHARRLPREHNWQFCYAAKRNGSANVTVARAGTEIRWVFVLRNRLIEGNLRSQTPGSVMLLTAAQYKSDDNEIVYFFHLNIH